MESSKKDSDGKKRTEKSSFISRRNSFNIVEKDIGVKVERKKRGYHTPFG